ncbi:unnamed protein product [Chrysoparadoxa australica]
MRGAIQLLIAQARMVREYNAWNGRRLKKHILRALAGHARESRQIREAAITLQCFSRSYLARARAVERRAHMARSEAIKTKFSRLLLGSWMELCFRHWTRYHDVMRREKAAVCLQRHVRGRMGRKKARLALEKRRHRDHLAANLFARGEARLRVKYFNRIVVFAQSSKRERHAIQIQRMVRGFIDRRYCARERHRRDQIDSKVLASRQRVCGPVYHGWKAGWSVARRERAGDRISRWAAGMHEKWRWEDMKKRIAKGKKLGAMAIGRSDKELKERWFRRWYGLVEAKAALKIQCCVRGWLAWRHLQQVKQQLERAKALMAKVMVPALRMCFGALVTNVEVRRDASLTLQCWWRCRQARLAVAAMRDRLGLHEQLVLSALVKRRAREMQKVVAGWISWLQEERAAIKIQSGVRMLLANKRACRVQRRLEGVLEASQFVLACHDQFIMKDRFHRLAKHLVKIRAATVIAAGWRGFVAREKAAWLRKKVLKQQEAMVVILEPRRIRLLEEAVQTYKGWCIDHKAAVALQKIARSWLLRRRIKALKATAACLTMRSMADGVQAYWQVWDRAVVLQSYWRRQQAWRHYIILHERQRVVGELLEKARSMRELRTYRCTWTVWQQVRRQEYAAAVSLQCLYRRLTAVKVVQIEREEKAWIESKVASSTAELRRRLLRRCLFSLEAAVVKAYKKAFWAGTLNASSPTTRPQARPASASSVQPEGLASGPGLQAARSSAAATVLRKCTGGLDGEEQAMMGMGKRCFSDSGGGHLHRKTRSVQGGRLKPLEGRRTEIVWDEDKARKDALAHPAQALWDPSLSGLAQHVAGTDGSHARAVALARRTGIFNCGSIGKHSLPQVYEQLTHAKTALSSHTTAEEVRVLSQALRSMRDATMVTKVIICNGTAPSFGEDAAASLVALATDCGIESLTLDSCQLGAKGALLLAQGLRVQAGQVGAEGSRLRELTLHACGVSNPGAAALSIALGNYTLEKLVLSGNRIGSVAATTQAVCDVLTADCSRLSTLVLSDTAISDADLTALSAAVQHQSCQLQNLYLARNPEIRSLGAQILATGAAVDSMLVTLDLAGCSVGDAGAIALASVLDSERSCLQALWLQGNAIQDKGVAKMAAAVARGKMHRDVNLDNNPYSSTALADECARLTSRKRFMSSIMPNCVAEQPGSPLSLTAPSFITKGPLGVQDPWCGLIRS